MHMLCDATTYKNIQLKKEMSIHPEKMCFVLMLELLVVASAGKH